MTDSCPRPLGAHLTATVVGLHEITANPADGDGGYVTPTQLRDYLRRKKSEGKTFVDLDGAFEDTARTTHNILVTLDDGYQGNYLHSDVFEEAGVPAVFFIHPSSIGSAQGAYPKMSWSQVIALSNNPLFEIGSHSWQHRDLSTVSLEDLRADFERTNATIRGHTGLTPRTIAYPSGRWNGAVVEAASGAYSQGCGFSYGQNSGQRTDRFALPRDSMYQNNVGRL